MPAGVLVWKAFKAEHSTSRLIVLSVKTFPRVARSIFLMSSRRTPKPRPAIQAITSYLKFFLHRLESSEVRDPFRHRLGASRNV